MSQSLSFLSNEEYMQLFRVDKLLYRLITQLLSYKPSNPIRALKCYFSGIDEIDEVPCKGSLQKLSLLHQLIHNIRLACIQLKHHPSNEQVERWGTVVYEAMMGPRRKFHTAQHAIYVSGDGSDPIEILAGSFHDVVYLQVDRGFSPKTEQKLCGFVKEMQGKWAIEKTASETPLCQMVLSIFGVKVGDALSVFEGLNELLSALCMAMELGELLEPSQIAQIAVSICCTIPFKATIIEDVYSRLVEVNKRFSLGLDGPLLDETLHTAVRICNRDVDNFADDVAAFLDNTWELLPESNPSLWNPSLYTVREYRLALMKMEGFLGSLNPAVVFHSFKGIPTSGAMNSLVAKVKINLNISVSYLRIKLYTMGLFEAIAEVTGGADVPIVYFMGSYPLDPNNTCVRVHHFLPRTPTLPGNDATIDRLLTVGRNNDKVAFDVKASPVSAFIYRVLGMKKSVEAVEIAKRMFKKEITSNQFLDQQDPFLVASIATASSYVATPRKEVLLNLAAKYKAGGTP